MIWFIKHYIIYSSGHKNMIKYIYINANQTVLETVPDKSIIESLLKTRDSLGTKHF